MSSMFLIMSTLGTEPLLLSALFLWMICYVMQFYLFRTSYFYWSLRMLASIRNSVLSFTLFQLHGVDIVCLFHQVSLYSAINYFTIRPLDHRLFISFSLIFGQFNIALFIFNLLEHFALYLSCYISNLESNQWYKIM